jgi:predicted RecA/RadA family phage recombinase
MAKNYIQEGEVLDVIASGSAITSGDVVVAGSLVGVALNTAAVGESASVSLCGVWEVAKATGALTVGQQVYWDASAKKVTATASSNTLMGYCWKAAASGDATAQVRLLFC